MNIREIKNTVAINVLTDLSNQYPEQLFVYGKRSFAFNTDTKNYHIGFYEKNLMIMQSDNENELVAPRTASDDNHSFEHLLAFFIHGFVTYIKTGKDDIKELF